MAELQKVGIAGRKVFKAFFLPFLQSCNPAILQS